MNAALRYPGPDPEVVTLAAEVRRLVGETRQLITEIDNTVVALDKFRQGRRKKVASLRDQGRENGDAT